MRTDLISRKALQNAIRREEIIIVEGLQYIRADVVSAKISMAPSVDAVEVTRCKDCRASEPCLTVRDGYLWCNAWDTVVREDGYCYHAEKGDEDAAD